VLLVSGTRGASLDVYFLVAGADLFRFRLCERWPGTSFTQLAGAGMLRGDHPYGPIDVLARLPFRQAHDSNALVRAGAFESEEGGRQRSTGSPTATIGQRRHDATRRAVSLVEQRADEFVLPSLRT